MASCNVTDFLLEGKAPEAPALRMLDGNHSYGELNSAVTQVAASLGRTGPAGSRILLIGDNSFFWVAAYLATLRAGLVSVPLPPSISARNLHSILTLTEARTAFVQARFLMNRMEDFAGLHIITDRDVSKAAGLA